MDDLQYFFIIIFLAVILFLMQSEFSFIFDFKEIKF